MVSVTPLDGVAGVGVDVAFVRAPGDAGVELLCGPRRVGYTRAVNVAAVLDVSGAPCQASQYWVRAV